MPAEIAWPLLVNGKPVPFAPIADLMTEKSFTAHREAVAGMGFALFTKRAKIGQSKHIRVRPRFESWSVSGQLVVTDEQITDDVMVSIFKAAGQYKGLCDWRPGSKTPGTFGMFTAEARPR
jgi:hypothetical protein